MKTPLIIGVSVLALLTLGATLFAQTTTGSSLITEMKAAVRSFTLAADLNPGDTGLQSAPLTGKRTGDMLTAAEYNRLLELIGQGGGGGGFTTTVFRDITAGYTGEASIKTYTCPVGQYVLSTSSILAPGGEYSCAVTANADKRSVSYNGCNPIAGQQWYTDVICGGGGGGNDGASATPKGMTVLNTPIGGSGTWTVPAGVTQIKVTLIGGGGGGSGGGYGAYAGGGGAGTITAYIGDLVPGTTIPYTLGRGGNGGAAPGQKDGTNTVFNGMTANGGGGGHATSGGASGGFSPVTTVTHGSVKGFVGFQGQGGSASGTGGHSGGGFGAGAHTTSSSVGYSGLAFGGGAGSSSTGGGGTGGPGGIIIEW